MSHQLSSPNGSLPLPDAAVHSYLGDAAHELYARSILQANQIYRILILPLPDIVLFPGETVPLRIQNREFILKLQEILKAIETNPSADQEFACHIGILRVNQRARSRLEAIGTTVEIRATYGRTTFDDEELIITTKGRHRFQLLNIMRLPPTLTSQRSSNVLVGQVKIFQDELILPKLSPRSAFSSFPISFYNHISPFNLAKRAFILLEKLLLWKGKNNDEVMVLQKWGYNEDHGKLNAELDPVAFSFSLCANLPIPSSDLQQLLNAFDVIDRLKLAIHYLLRSQQLQSKIGCIVCNQIIANKKDLFNVPGAEGCAGAYVNSYGAVHQTMTFRQLEVEAMIELNGDPSTEDSWFPGYAWTIVHCQRCYNHLGWRFTLATNEENERGQGEGQRRRQRNDTDSTSYPQRRQRTTTTNNSTAFTANSIFSRLIRQYTSQLEDRPLSPIDTEFASQNPQLISHEDTSEVILDEENMALTSNISDSEEARGEIHHADETHLTRAIGDFFTAFNAVNSREEDYESSEREDDEQEENDEEDSMKEDQADSSTYHPSTSVLREFW